MKEELRDIPAYSPSDAAKYVRVKARTLRSWLTGNTYTNSDGILIQSRPVITTTDQANKILSFNNLIEAHIIAVLRNRFRISMPKIRKAIDYLEEMYPGKHPLLENLLKTDGSHIFLEISSSLEIISQSGQYGMKPILDDCLSRIDSDDMHLPLRLYPYTRAGSYADPRLVVIDPTRSFGTPIIKTSSVPTEIIANRFNAGESVIDLAEDYGTKPEEIEEAIRWQTLLLAA